MNQGVKAAIVQEIGHPATLFPMVEAGIGISVPGLIARVATVAEAPVRGLAVAFYTFVLFVGASLGPWLAQQTAQRPTGQAFLVLAVLLGAATLYAMTGRRAIAA